MTCRIPEVGASLGQPERQREATRSSPAMVEDGSRHVRMSGLTIVNRRQWHPPPGWPTPPQGWSPSPGWRPDSSWPKPPDDWEWWRRVRRTTREWILLALIPVLGALVATPVVLYPMLVAGRSTQIWDVLLVNDTTQTWTICGDNCAHHEPVLPPGDSITIETDGDEIFLVQHGRETNDCLFPGYRRYSLLRISARRDCVR